MMYRLCNDLEKNKILKSNGFKDYRWWSIRDLKKCALRFHDNFLIDTR